VSDGGTTVAELAGMQDRFLAINVLDLATVTGGAAKKKAAKSAKKGEKSKSKL
jgi:hypothetical protein